MIPNDKHIAEPASIYPDNSPQEEPNKNNDPVKKKFMSSRILRGILFSIGGVILLLVLLLCGATWWLTPERLTEIVNREASENLYADVKAHNIRFTLWSSWPHLCVEFDSVTVRSRVFDSIPENIKNTLPDNADFLASTGKFKGGINLPALIMGKISLRNVDLASLRLNLVTLNDSLSNFNIVPPDTVKTRIPYFTADKVRLLNPGIISYRSVQDSADARVALNTLAIGRVEHDGKRKKKDLYRLKIIGNIDAAVSGLSILKGFPFELGGNIGLGFDPFRISTSGYNVNMGSIRGNIDMKMQVGGESRLDDFKWHLDNFDLIRLLSYIPDLQLPSQGNFDAPLTVNATARLTSPWRLSSNLLPSAEVDFQIVDGEMTYTLDSGQSISLRHDGAGGKLIFDGINPEESSFIIPPFSISGEGVDVTLGASMTKLLGQPEVEATVEGAAGGRTIKCLADIFPVLKGMDLTGKANALASISCRLAPLSQITSAPDPVTDIRFDGKLDLKDFKATLPGNKMRASGKSLEVDFAYPAEITDLTAHNDQSIPILIKGSGMNFSMKESKMNMNLKDMAIAGSMPAAFIYGASVSEMPIKADFKSSSFNMTAGKDRLQLNNISLKLDAVKAGRPIKTRDYTVPEKWISDMQYDGRIPHSDRFLHVKAPSELKQLMQQWRTSLNVKIGSGIFSTPDFPAANHIRNIDMAASFDSVVIRNISMRSRSSAMSMRGKITNLRQFLNSSTPAPLYLRMDVAIDTIQVNQLAGTYMRGLKKKGKQHSLDTASSESSGEDTIALLLPRNIIADIKATAKQSQYLDLRLYDMATGLYLRDGDMNVKNLQISADFGRAFLNYGLSTSDIQNISMDMDASLLNVNLVRFFDNFHTLLLMMPQMKNLDGYISAEMNFNLLTFPNMYVNIPSVTGDIRVQGDGLTVHQSDFIRHITKMLLIRNKGDLHIANMDVHASIHDNLLELYPFNFIVNNYRLRMGGVNNFDGDLYYHIGVDKSPIPFPFGINVVGNIDHPKIRFGGAHWKIKKGEEITSSVMEKHRINIVAEGKKFLKEFIRKAAEADK